MEKSTGDVQCFKRKEAWGTCSWASSLRNNWKWKKITTSPPWMLFHGLVNQPGETCNNSSMNISICGFKLSSDTAWMRIGCFESYNRNVSIGIQERGNIRQGGLSLMQYLRSGSCSWQGWPRSSGLGCPGGACNEPGMPVAGGMAPPAMANASIFASSHKLQISQLDVGQQIQLALEKSLNYSNLGIGLKVWNCNWVIISAAYCKLSLQASPRRCNQTLIN